MQGINFNYLPETSLSLAETNPIAVAIVRIAPETSTLIHPIALATPRAATITPARVVFQFFIFINYLKLRYFW